MEQSRREAGSTGLEATIGPIIQTGKLLMREFSGAFVKSRGQALESFGRQAHNPRMSTEEIVHDLLPRLPGDASLRDVAREIEFVAAVRHRLAELDRGERIAIDDVESELPAWVIK